MLQIEVRKNNKWAKENQESKNINKFWGGKTHEIRDSGPPWALLGHHGPQRCMSVGSKGLSNQFGVKNGRPMGIPFGVIFSMKFVFLRVEKVMDFRTLFGR